MTSRETQLLHRLYGVVAEIPLPNGYGTSSASISGVMGYVNDMRFTHPKISEVLNYLSFGELENAKEVILELEVWALDRKAVDWK